MLRKLLLLIFSLWLGIGIGVSFVAIPQVFSPAIRDSMPAGGAGRIAQGILLRFFQWQLALAGSVVVLHQWARRRSPGSPDRVQSALQAFLLGMSLAALFWLHPRLLHLYQDKYRADLPEAARKEAAAAFGRWHGGSQLGNLLILAGVLACWWRLAQPLSQVPLPERNQPTGRG